MQNKAVGHANVVHRIPVSSAANVVNPNPHRQENGLAPAAQRIPANSAENAAVPSRQGIGLALAARPIRASSAKIAAIPDRNFIWGCKK